MASSWKTQRALRGTTSSLLAATGVTTVLGLVFWWVAAHRLPVAAVGCGLSAILAMTLVGGFGMAGLNAVLTRHLVGRPMRALRAPGRGLEAA